MKKLDVSIVNNNYCESKSITLKDSLNVDLDVPEMASSKIF